MTLEEQAAKHRQDADTYAACAVAMVDDIEAKRAFELACFESITALSALEPRPDARGPRAVPR